MSDIFISYATEDRAKAKILAETLEQQGYSVWWDRKILPGKTFHKVIEEELKAARSVIVLWSESSVKSDWVMKEAHVADERKILVPALIEDVEIPFWFKNIQTARLVGWQGESSDPEVRQLFEAIATILGSAMVAEKGSVHKDIRKSETSEGERHGSEVEEEKVKRQPAAEREVGYSTRSIRRSRLMWLLPSIFVPFIIGMVMLAIYLSTRHSEIPTRGITIGEPTHDSVEEEPPSLKGMIFIKGGSFDMGDTFGDGESNEKPVHQVYVDGFYMGKYEVTMKEFRKFVDETGYKTDAEKEGWGWVLNSSGDKWEKRDGVNWRGPGFYKMTVIL